MKESKWKTWVGVVFIIGIFVLIQLCEQAWPSGFVAPFADNGTEEATGYMVTPWPDSHEWLKENGWFRVPSQLLRGPIAMNG